MFTSRATARQRGISLMELVLFIVIVGIGVVGILNAMNLTTKLSSDPLRRKQALMIAEGLMEEVQLARFTFCDPSDPLVESATSASACSVPEKAGPEAGETRPYDNVSDYVHSYGVAERAFDSGGVLTDAAGQAINPTGYTAWLTVTAYTGWNGAVTSAPASTDLLKITVSVSYNGGEAIQLDGFRFRYAPNAPP